MSDLYLLFVLALGDQILHIGLSQETCIHNADTTLTLELRVKCIGLLTLLVFGPQIMSFDIVSHTIFGTLVYHHGAMCHIHSCLYIFYHLPYFQNEYVCENFFRFLFYEIAQRSLNQNDLNFTWTSKSLKQR